MPVLLDSATGSGFVTSPLANTATSATATQSINVNPSANDLTAVAALFWSSEATDTSGSTFGVTFAGDAMSPLGSAQRWGSNHNYLQVFTLDNPQTGAGKSVVGTASSLPTGPGGEKRFLLMVVATYSGVGAVGSATTAGGSTSTSNSVTFGSVLPAHRAVSVHATSGTVQLGTPNGAPRAFATGVTGSLVVSCALFLQDTPGAASVTLSAPQDSTANWGAKGFDLTPAPVNIDASLNIALSMSSSGAIYRVETPEPRRTWVIEA